jgi:hypothetical protein
MAARRPQVFYSFHFDNDVFRVQQIWNIGAIEGNEPVSKNDWPPLVEGLLLLESSLSSFI